jgi:hypothetical protein
MRTQLITTMNSRSCRDAVRMSTRQRADGALLEFAGKEGVRTAPGHIGVLGPDVKANQTNLESW